MNEKLIISQDLAQQYVDAGFDGGTENVTYEQLMNWLRDKKKVHVNILAGLERDGSVKYYVKSIIDHSAEFTFKKKKCDSYEQCAKEILTQLAGALV